MDFAYNENPYAAGAQPVHGGEMMHGMGAVPGTVHEASHTGSYCTRVHMSDKKSIRMKKSPRKFIH